ncbi:MAG: O-antigen ligase family protein, partial [Nitrospirae bacterium]|nr:O-antigen ligase family protein [Nitrospirota bacterium]
ILAFDARYNDSPVPYPWESKNGFAVDLVSVIGFAALLFLWQQKRILKVEAAFYFVVLFMGIIGSNSRGNYVAVGVVFMLLLLKNFKIKYLLLLVVLISLVLVRVSDVHWERFSSITVDTDQGGTGGQRLALWSTGLRMIGANPLLGVGPGEFPLQFSRYANWQEQKRVGGSNLGSEKINVHNMYLQIGAENGLIGLALYLMIIAFSMRNILVAQRLCRGDPGLQDLMPFVVGLGLGFVGYLVAGIFGNYGYRLQFYTLVALATVTKFVVEEARVHKKQESTRQSDAGFILTRFQVPIRALAFILFSYMTLQL